MEKYNKGKIYKVINSVDEKVYIGSTTQSLSRRMGNHRENCKDLNRNSKIYKHMRNIGVQYFKIVLIQNFPCSSKEELECEEFKELSKYEKDQLLNEDILYKQKSKEHSMKVGKCSLGDKSANWKFGSIFRRQGKSSDGYDISAWCFAYREYNDDDKKVKRLQFSVKKYGEEQAREKAIQAQKEIFPDAPSFEMNK